jgi:hypothetical protein
MIKQQQHRPQTKSIFEFPKKDLDAKTKELERLGIVTKREEWE